MSYIEPNTWKEKAERIFALADRLLELKRIKGYSDIDARGAALTNCRSHCLYAGSILNIFCAAEEGRLDNEYFCNIIGLVKGSPVEIANIIEKSTRLGFLVLFQFQIENLFGNLLHTLGEQPRPGYYNLISIFIESLGLMDSEEKIKFLYLPAQLRNSLHSNGIHHGYKGECTTIEIGGFTFELIDGQKVSCAGWGHIVLALNASLEILEEILSSPKIQTLKDPIRDQYVWELEGIE